MCWGSAVVYSRRRWRVIVDARCHHGAIWIRTPWWWSVLPAGRCRRPPAVSRSVPQIPASVQQVSSKCPASVQQVSSKCPASVQQVSSKCPANSSKFPQIPAKSRNVPQSPAKSRKVPQSPATSRKVPQSPAKSRKVPQRPATSRNVPHAGRAGPCWTMLDHICGTLTSAIELRTIQPKKKKSRRFWVGAPTLPLLPEIERIQTNIEIEWYHNLNYYLPWKSSLSNSTNY
jgi:hypothetical protein